ncbi:galactokinase family protein [Aestuariimicrobium ganziense]|uniref:galactokinase family protein n=1 Tax=Aestuariimicrobium ganziense TaxID=2773677 RepID=UPI001A9B06A7|nr:galactokinase family protein [Aestuariimicrobium ganziense]
MNTTTTGLDEVAWFAPGRIEVLGKHTDYAGGRSLLAAVDRGVTVRAERRDQRGVSARSSSLEGDITLAAGIDPQLPPGHWGGYLQAAIERLTLNFGELAGAHLEVTSTLPLASGMSSSSALIVGLSMALAELNGLPETEVWQAAITDRIDLAGYLACVENGMTFKNLEGHRGVGTFGGSEDHTGMLCTQPHMLGQFSFCPIRHERDLPFPDDLSFAVMVSGVSAEKTGAARDLYNRASLATREIVQRWNESTGSNEVVIADVLAGGDDAADRLRALVADDDYLSKRLHQFLEESTRIVPAAGDAFVAGDWQGFGAMVDESQKLSQTDLGNQVPETVSLAAQARELGALAASAFGAGFGGSVWALVPTSGADEFAAAWLERHRAAHPEAGLRATSITTRPGDPAKRLD